MESFIRLYVTVLTALVGLCVGSFLNVVIYRLPEGMSLAKPASHCPKCQYVLRWYDNIPLFSYLILGGRCRKCREKISFRYFAVELGNMLLWLCSLWCVGLERLPLAVLTCAVCSLYLCVALIDWDHKIIFDLFWIIIAVLGVVALFLEPEPDWLGRLIGAAAGGLSFAGIGFLVTKLCGREAMGQGDIFLTASSGLLLGWEKLLLAVLLASVSASVMILVSRRRKRSVGDEASEEDARREYPFAPFLSLGFTVALLAGDWLIGGYLSLITG